MLSMNVKEKRVKTILIEEGQRDKEVYKQLWKEKYNIVIAKEGETNYDKILNFVKGKNL
jgi:hypothetical protein